MRKIPTLFVREFLPNHKIIITDQVAPGCEWVLAGEGVATRKLDGTCTPGPGRLSVQTVRC